MDKEIILDAYKRGLLSEDECAKILGVDPAMLIMNNEGTTNIYELKSNTR